MPRSGLSPQWSDRPYLEKPFSREEVRTLLAGWRGAAPSDLTALADVVVAFSTLATELGDALDAVEANPVIASARGAVAVDTLVVMRGRVGE